MGLNWKSPVLTVTLPRMRRSAAPSSKFTSRCALSVALSSPVRTRSATVEPPLVPIASIDTLARPVAGRHSGRACQMLVVSPDSRLGPAPADRFCIRMDRTMARRHDRHDRLPKRVRRKPGASLDDFAFRAGHAVLSLDRGCDIHRDEVAIADIRQAHSLRTGTNGVDGAGRVTCKA
jgi:hypothetical protein